MLKIKKISEIIGKHVYTADGEYFGQIEDVNLMDNKIDGWKIRVSGSFISSLGGARGVIIPQQFVRAIGDVVVVTRGSLPSRDENIDMPSSPNNSSQPSGGSMMTSGSGFESF